MHTRPTLVIGATGHVGGQTVQNLRRSGVPVRALVRNPSAAKLPEDVEIAPGDLTDPDALSAAVTGVDKVFLVFPTLVADDRAPSIIEIISDRVRHLVYLSAAGVPDKPDDQNPGGILGSHARLERLIREAGVAWTFLRSGGMATNTLGWAPQIRASRTVRWAFADAARPLIHEADLGACAAHLLTSEGHEGAVYVATGLEVLTHGEQAEAIGAALGERVAFVEASRAEMREQMVSGWGWDGQAADQALDAWHAMVADPEQATDTVARLLQRPARPFSAWARDHAEDFR